MIISSQGIPQTSSNGSQYLNNDCNEGYLPKKEEEEAKPYQTYPRIDRL